MYINYRTDGEEKKRLVQAVAEITGREVKYLGAPSFSYLVAGVLEISKNGVLAIPDTEDKAEIDRLLSELSARGFVGEGMEVHEEQPKEEPKEETVTMNENEVVIEIPKDKLPDEAIDNLKRIIESKGELMKHAFGADDLPLTITDEKVGFPWFKDISPENVSAYAKFVTALCHMARTQKRITAKAKDSEHEKYAFRCFLLRLGFIGNEYKEERRILLQNLSGSAAFPTQKAAEEFAAKQKAKRDAEKAEATEEAEASEEVTA